MIDLALERVKAEDSKRRAELEAQRSDAEAAHAALAEKQRLRASRVFYHFGRLPVEIAHTIFTLVVAEDHARVVVLGQVCRDWRRVVVEMPSLWTHLSLSTVNPTVKAALWKARSKGKLKALCVHSGDAKIMWALQVLETLPPDHLRTLSLAEVNFGAFRRQLPLLSHQVICRLDTLELHDPLLSLDLYWLFHPPTLQLRTLVVRGVPIRWGDLAERCEQLTTLSYHGCFNATYLHDLVWLLQRNSDLAVVELIGSENVMSRKYMPFGSVSLSTSSPDQVSLSALTKLSLGGPFLGSDIFCKLICTNLRSLHISRWIGTIDTALEHALATASPTHLEELIIDRCSLSDPTTLVHFLESAKSLKFLHLLGLTRAAPVFEALGEPRSNGFLCPQLTHLNVTHSYDLRDGPLLRIVKARLPSESPLTDEAAQDDTTHIFPRPTQLVSLILDGCQSVSADILPWLRQKVPHVSCQFATKRQAKWKR